MEDEGLILSDNSHKDDAKYLNKLLTEENLGEVRDNKIFISPAANVEKIFYKENRLIENGFFQTSWESFVHYSHALKVPVRNLEPFVARYVKAVSACGAATWLSCDGNHPTDRKIQRILVEFAGNPSALWHEIIFNNFFTRYFEFLRRRPTSGLNLIFRQADKWKAYVEFNRAAEFLYDNRIELRRIRREDSDKIGTSRARHLPSEELEKNFFEYATELLEKSSFIARNHFFGGRYFLWRF